MSQQPDDGDQDDDRAAEGRSSPWRRLSQQWAAFDLRDRWWRLLDLWEARRTLRRLVYGALAAVVAVIVVEVWIYPWWVRRNALSIARQWINAGRLDNAAEAVKDAMAAAPDRPEPWQLAAELAQLRGRKAEVVDDARQAAALGGGNPDLVLTWAAAALRADQFDEAHRALAKLPPAESAKSAFAQRLLGELARRKGALASAKDHFEAALRLDGPGAINEVPLGLILINAADPAWRQRGIGLLSKWTADPEWGTEALRPLLEDAIGKDDRPGMLKWAQALRAHPRCTLGDMPDCLLALSKTDERLFGDAVAALEKDDAASPESAAQLVGWLNQIGRSDEACRWMKTLPLHGTPRPPLAVVGAEALRQAAAWRELEDWTRHGDWGDLDFLRWLYGMEAGRRLGDNGSADEFWQTLRNHAAANSVHALFAGSTIYTWGRVPEAEALWWAAADQTGPAAIDALGTLARHYQVRRDAEGQYRAFRQLHFLHPQDAGATNNFIYFAALTGNGGPLVEQLAKDNLAHNPQDRAYLATCAFVDYMQGRNGEALAMLKPVAADAAKSPALSFAYGLALAGAGRKTEARALLEPLSSTLQTTREVELIKSALNSGPP
jgi:tetratricopeptide (TPR) repeat protein